MFKVLVRDICSFRHVGQLFSGLHMIFASLRNKNMNYYSNAVILKHISKEFNILYQIYICV